VSKETYTSVIFARCRRSSGFWVQIVEKAFAKLHGSYGSLSGVSTVEALHDLTGRV
jgi:calpain